MHLIASPARAARAKFSWLGITGAAALLALAALGGCVAYPNGAVGPIGPEVYVDAAPPAPLYENVTIAPSVGYVWIPGFWNWYGGRYTWNAGRWGRPPQGYNHWRPGQWQHTPRGHRWTGGQWDRSPSVQQPPAGVRRPWGGPRQP